MDSKVDAKEATSNLEAAQDPEPSYEACHKVLETVELLEMILLRLHGSQDMFCVADSQHDNTADLSTWCHDNTSESPISDGGIEYAYTQDEAHCNMKTLLLSQRVNRMFKGTIQGSTKLQKGLWFTELEDISAIASEKLDGFPRINPLFSKRYATPVHIEGFWSVSTFTPRRTLYVDFKRKGKIVSNGQPESWNRMLIAQSDDPTAIPMKVRLPNSDYSYAVCGPIRKVFEGPETASYVLRHAEESEHRAYLGFLRANWNEEQLRQEVKELKAEGGWLYDLAKANLEDVRRELIYRRAVTQHLQRGIW